MNVYITDIHADHFLDGTCNLFLQTLADVHCAAVCLQYNIDIRIDSPIADLHLNAVLSIIAAVKTCYAYSIIGSHLDDGLNDFRCYGCVSRYSFFFFHIYIYVLLLINLVENYAPASESRPRLLFQTFPQ